MVRARLYKPSTHGAKTLFRQEKPLQTEIAPLLSWRTVEPSTAKPLPRSHRQRITNGRLDKFFYALTQAGWERRRGPPTALCVCVSYMCTAFVLMGRGFLLPPPLLLFRYLPLASASHPHAASLEPRQMGHRCVQSKGGVSRQ